MLADFKFKTEKDIYKKELFVNGLKQYGEEILKFYNFKDRD